jgi:hypothetical protein
MLLVVALTACTTSDVSPVGRTGQTGTVAQSTTSTTAGRVETSTTTATTPSAPRMTRVFEIPGPEPDSDGASGSGCSPRGDDLGDGTWFGYVTAIQPDAVEFDLACWYFGDIAHAKAAEKGEEAFGDLWIVNDSSRTRTVPTSNETMVWRIDGDISNGLHEGIPYSEWNGETSTYTQCPRVPVSLLDLHE